MLKSSKVTITKADGSIIDDVVSLGRSEVLEGSIDGLADIAKNTYRPVGHCIYCLSTEDLRREHIIPYGLGGTTVLGAASCPRCAKITSAFEAQVLRGSFRPVRFIRQLRSRTKHRNASRTGKLKIVRNGITETVELPIEELPLLLPFPEFDVPRFLTNQDSPGISLKGISTISFGPSPEIVAKRLGAERIVLDSDRDHPVAFARMIAKIGYSMAFAEGILSQLDGPCLVLPAIIERPDEIGCWVGTLTDSIRKYPGLLCRIEIREDHQKRLLLAEVQLFADSETPSYGVILGRLKI